MRRSVSSPVSASRPSIAIDSAATSGRRAVFRPAASASRNCDSIGAAALSRAARDACDVGRLGARHRALQVGREQHAFAQAGFAARGAQLVEQRQQDDRDVLVAALQALQVIGQQHDAAHQRRAGFVARRGRPRPATPARVAPFPRRPSPARTAPPCAACPAPGAGSWRRNACGWCRRDPRRRPRSRSAPGAGSRRAPA